MNQGGFWDSLYKRHRFLVRCILILSLLGAAVYFLGDIINSSDLFILSCFLLIISGMLLALDILAWQVYQDRKYEEIKNARLEALEKLRKTLKIK